MLFVAIVVPTEISRKYYFHSELHTIHICHSLKKKKEKTEKKWHSRAGISYLVKRTSGSYKLENHHYIVIGIVHLIMKFIAIQVN